MTEKINLEFLSSFPTLPTSKHLILMLQSTGRFFFSYYFYYASA